MNHPKFNALRNASYIPNPTQTAESVNEADELKVSVGANVRKNNF